MAGENINIEELLRKHMKVISLQRNQSAAALQHRICTEELARAVQEYLVAKQLLEKETGKIYNEETSQLETRESERLASAGR